MFDINAVKIVRHRLDAVNRRIKARETDDVAPDLVAERFYRNSPIGTRLIAVARIVETNPYSVLIVSRNEIAGVILVWKDERAADRIIIGAVRNKNTVLIRNLHDRMQLFADPDPVVDDHIARRDICGVALVVVFRKVNSILEIAGNRVRKIEIADDVIDRSAAQNNPVLIGDRRVLRIRADQVAGDLVFGRPGVSRLDNSDPDPGFGIAGNRIFFIDIIGARSVREHNADIVAHRRAAVNARSDQISEQVVEIGIGFDQDAGLGIARNKIAPRY